MSSTTALCQFTIFDLWTIKHAVLTAGRGWKRRGGDYPLTKTDLPVTIWSLPLLHSHHNGSPWQIYSQAMLLVKGECMQAEFKAWFKNSGGLGAKISLFVLKMLQSPQALSLTWLQNYKTHNSHYIHFTIHILTEALFYPGTKQNWISSYQLFRNLQLKNSQKILELKWNVNF